MDFELSFVHFLVLLSAGISISGAIPYIRDTLKGKTKPNRVSWSMWALAPLVGTAAALSAHADVWATVRIFLAGFLPLIIFFTSFINPKGFWELTAFDLICGACSIFALIIWIGIDSPQLAILFAAIGDGFATFPTIRKSWKHPETETGITYVASFIAVILILPSIPKWNIENSAFQIYLLLATTTLVFAVYRKQFNKFIATYVAR